jgi:phenylacetic acid degradation operon negative regulatory protein
MGNRTARMLLAFLESTTKNVLDITDAFLMSAGSTRRLVRNLGMIDREYYSSMQSLRRSGCIRKINENQFLITPKGIARAQKFEKEMVVFDKENWQGKWILVVFDIPESQRKQRHLLRSVLKRMGLIGLQRSVFIAPFANLEKVLGICREIGVVEYITFFHGDVSSGFDDRKLREKFGLI